MNNAMKRISGRIIYGNQYGKKLGFPTANLDLHDPEIESGVYIGKVYFNDTSHNAAIFIDEEKKLLEAHILDFEGNLYGKEIEVEIGEKIREVVKFASEKKLINQILKDLLIVRSVEK